MTSGFIALLFSIGSFGLLAEAREVKIPLEYCLNARAISKQAIICHNNPEFVSWGQRCLDRFVQLTEAETKRMQARFSVSDSLQQSKQLGVSVTDYQKALASLDFLIGINHVAIADIKNYQKELITPIDDRYLEEVKCYTENRAGLREVLKNFEQKLAELEAARKVAAANQSSSAGREESLTNSVGVSAVKSGKQSVGPSVGKKKSNPASDITGTVEDRAKRAK